MSEATLSVAFRELFPMPVAYIACPIGEGLGAPDDRIRESFRLIQAWFREMGWDPDRTLTLGAIETLHGRPSSYDCCLELPEPVDDCPEGLSIRELPGGLYVIVDTEKDPAQIGDAIGRFWQQYVPEHGIAVDGSRPTYEIYWETTMEYCVPVL